MKFTCTFLTALACFNVVLVQQSHGSEESAIYQLLQDIWSWSDASMQERDALYPITRYAGMGYNFLRGNPEGDFIRGGKDPGILNTRWIFNLTYSMGSEGYYGGKTVAIPDQVNFHPMETSTKQSSTRAYSGQTSYQEELNRNINAGISGDFLNLAKLGFSLSAGMKKVEEKTNRNGRIVIQETEIRNMGSVRYKDELIADEMDPYLFSQGFKYAVRSLPQSFSTDDETTAYMTFIENWGTHVIFHADIGTRKMQKRIADYDEVYREMSKQKSFGGSLNAGGGVSGVSASGEIGLDLKTINENANELNQVDNSTITTNVGSEEFPAPIFLTLKPIAEVLTKSAWGPTWEDYGIDARQRNLKKALNMYPDYVGAQIDKDPPIKVVPKLMWLSGTFALPAAKSECPKGFHTGSITQDTYNLFNYNSASYGIDQRLNVKVLEGSVETNFCVKTKRLDDEFNWPGGSYCIGQKGLACPKGFLKGFIKWDDKDLRNKNKNEGELPKGKYDENTVINFCCRSDNGSPTNAIQLPTQEPFVLYRRGRKCQEVKGMRVVEDYILWNDEFAFNKDETGGSIPDDDGGKKKHKLHYCHYSPYSKK